MWKWVEQQFGKRNYDFNNMQSRLKFSRLKCMYRSARELNDPSSFRYFKQFDKIFGGQHLKAPKKRTPESYWNSVQILQLLKICREIKGKNISDKWNYVRSLLGSQQFTAIQIRLKFAHLKRRYIKAKKSGLIEKFNRFNYYWQFEDIFGNVGCQNIKNYQL